MLELIAILSMVIDHAGKVFFPNMVILRIIGRIAFPVYGYLIFNGVKYTRSVKSYFVRVLMLAIISQPLYVILFNAIGLNICFSLAFAILAISIINYKKIDILAKIILVAGVSIVSLITGNEFGIYGIVVILLFFIKNIPLLLVLQLVWNISSIYVFSYPIYQIFAFLGIMLCVLLGRKTKTYNLKIIPKRFNYFIYPIHLLILLIIRYLIKG